MLQSLSTSEVLLGHSLTSGPPNPPANPRTSLCPIWWSYFPVTFVPVSYTSFFGPFFVALLMIVASIAETLCPIAAYHNYCPMTKVTMANQITPLYLFTTISSWSGTVELRNIPCCSKTDIGNPSGLKQDFGSFH